MRVHEQQQHRHDQRTTATTITAKPESVTTEAAWQRRMLRSRAGSGAHGNERNQTNAVTWRGREQPNNNDDDALRTRGRAYAIAT